MSDHDSGVAVLAILEEESRLSRRMLRLAEAKREALLAVDLDSLSPLVREMESLTAALERLERDRIAHAAAAAGPEATTANCLALAERLGGPTGARLASLRDELLASLQELRLVNAGNAGLVRQALQFNDRYLKLIRRAASGTYAPTGAAVGATPSRRAWSA